MFCVMVVREVVSTRYVDEERRKVRGTKKLNCPFEIIAGKQVCGGWMVKVGKNDRHSHALTNCNQ